VLKIKAPWKAGQASQVARKLIFCDKNNVDLGKPMKLIDKRITLKELEEEGVLSEDPKIWCPFFEVTDSDICNNP